MERNLLLIVYTLVLFRISHAHVLPLQFFFSFKRKNEKITGLRILIRILRWINHYLIES